MSGIYEITSRNYFKAEEILSMELMREHTKTNDVATVSDSQLELYRDTAFEQAEKYTGRIILGSARIYEKFEFDASQERRPRSYYRYKLSYLPIEKQIFFSGAGGAKQRGNVRANSRKIDVPRDGMTVNMNSCCAGSGMMLEGSTTYTTGYLNKDDIPSTIIYGCLKFIAWSVGNPGDELMTVRNRLGTTETGLIGTNNASWASGAIEHWKGYKVT